MIAVSRAGHASSPNVLVCNGVALGSALVSSAWIGWVHCSMALEDGRTVVRWLVSRHSAGRSTDQQSAVG
jgi:hypothetical protein